MPRSEGLSVNIAAFLDTIAVSELGRVILKASDDGYNVLVGSTPAHVVTFDSYAHHPHQAVVVRPGLVSTAAGRYQILGKFADAYCEMLGLPDFSPVNQDTIALQMIRECRALPDIEQGRIEPALTACASRWASLPGAAYGQHTNLMADLLAAYRVAGGEAHA